MTFAAKGSTGSVALPAQSITFTPMAGQTAKPVITCTTSTAAQDVTITVGDASGAFYHCTTTVASESPDQERGPGPADDHGDRHQEDWRLPHDQPHVRGHSARWSPPPNRVAAGATLDNAAFSADLAVTGAQSGTVHITKTITDLTATTFSASAKLKLTKAGTVKVDIPSKFGLALSASGTVAGGPRRARWSPSPPRSR